MELDPAGIDWAACDDSTVYYAARDGVPQAKAEMRKRSLASATSPAHRAALAARVKAHQGR